MTALAVKQLSAKEEGYFLLVEAGRIDHAHHFSNAFRALGDTVALSEAVQWTVDNVDLSETLILVTADHSHTMTISGYPRRGNPILGTVEMEPGKPMLDATGKPYTTLSYANGPGYRKQRQTSATSIPSAEFSAVGHRANAGRDPRGRGCGSVCHGQTRRPCAA